MGKKEAYTMVGSLMGSVQHTVMSIIDQYENTIDVQQKKIAQLEKAIEVLENKV